jgi:hypothetical protein
MRASVARAGAGKETVSVRANTKETPLQHGRLHCPQPSGQQESCWAGAYRCSDDSELATSRVFSQHASAATVSVSQQLSAAPGVSTAIRPVT